MLQKKGTFLSEMAISVNLTAKKPFLQPWSTQQHNYSNRAAFLSDSQHLNLYFCFAATLLA